MRVGVGVGAVMLSGCDAVAEAKARVLGEEAAATETKVAADAPAPAPVAAPPVAPEPMLLSRDDGMASLVQDAVAKSKAESGVTAPTVPPPTPVLPVEDLGRPRPEPEGSHAFVPYAGRGSTLTGVLPEPERFDSVKPRERPRPKLARPVEDEPCEPGKVGSSTTPPEREWVCGPCGRG